MHRCTPEVPSHGVSLTMGFVAGIPARRLPRKVSPQFTLMIGLPLTAMTASLTATASNAGGQHERICTVPVTIRCWANIGGQAFIYLSRR